MDSQCRAVWVGMGAVALLALAGCGGSSSAGGASGTSGTGSAGTSTGSSAAAATDPTTPSPAASGPGSTASAAPSAAAGAAWSWTDGAGRTVTVDHVPERIVAHASAASALIPLGIRPVGIYADMPVADDPGLRGLDLTGIEVISEVWGEMNVEKIAALQPDLVLAEWWPTESAYSGMEAETGNEPETIEQIAPVAGVAQGDSIATMIEDYEDLAVSLGADLDRPDVQEDRARFAAARTAFTEALAAKPGLTVLAVSPSQDALYVAVPDDSAELSDFRAWGMDLVDPDSPEARGYFENLSWENAGKYQGDLVIVDDRGGPAARELAESMPTWTSLQAAAAGAVTDWPTYWVRSSAAYATELDELTAAIEAADPDLV
jgi:iron complex transport system substrate-binding protein